MNQWLRHARWMVPFVVAGVVLTCTFAWMVPLALSMRGMGPKSADSRRLFASIVPAESVFTPTIDVRRGACSDWCVAESAWDGVRMYWPDTMLVHYRADRDDLDVVRAAPIGAVLSPPPSERDRYARIDTGLSGWPFRAFASEAWFAKSASGEGHDAIPEHRWNIFLGEMKGKQLLVPLRPLALGLTADVSFWSCVSWIVVALPQAIRRRLREKYGRCRNCGHTVNPHALQKPRMCPECGVAFANDPLRFADSLEMHFQNAYVWFVLVSSLDIMLTWKILERGGREVNPLAAFVIDAWGMYGATAFKFALMMWVIIACELLARLRRSAGKFLAYAAVIISAAPVVWSLALLVAHLVFPSAFASLAE